MCRVVVLVQYTPSQWDMPILYTYYYIYADISMTFPVDTIPL